MIILLSGIISFLIATVIIWLLNAINVFLNKFQKETVKKSRAEKYRQHIKRLKKCSEFYNDVNESFKKNFPFSKKELISLKSLVTISSLLFAVGAIYYYVIGSIFGISSFQDISIQNYILQGMKIISSLDSSNFNLFVTTIFLFVYGFILIFFLSTPFKSQNRNSMIVILSSITIIGVFSVFAVKKILEDNIYKNVAHSIGKNTKTVILTDSNYNYALLNDDAEIALVPLDKKIVNEDDVRINAIDIYDLPKKSKQEILKEFKEQQEKSENKLEKGIYDNILNIYKTKKESNNE